MGNHRVRSGSIGQVVAEHAPSRSLELGVALLVAGGGEGVEGALLGQVDEVDGPGDGVGRRWCASDPRRRRAGAKPKTEHSSWVLQPGVLERGVHHVDAGDEVVDAAAFDQDPAVAEAVADVAHGQGAVGRSGGCRRCRLRWRPAGRRGRRRSSSSSRSFSSSLCMSVKF